MQLSTRNRLVKWQSSLMDMSRKNPLLAFKPRLTSTVQIAGSPSILYDALLQKKETPVREFFPFEELIRQAEEEHRRLESTLTPEVNERVQSRLAGLLDDFGWAILSDIPRLERLLQDAGDAIPYPEALTEAARVGAAPALIKTATIDYPLFDKHRRSVEEGGTDPYLAEWSLKMWLAGSGAAFSMEEAKQAYGDHEEKSKQRVIVEQEIERLEKRLNKIRLNSQLILRERGINVLYMAFGFLRWYEDDSSAEWLSPLFLIPVVLNRSTAGVTSIRAAEDEVMLNPMLVHKLKSEFQFELPKLPEEFAEVTLSSLVETYKKALQSVSRFRGWTVLEDTYLCILSFNKLAMYQDYERHMALMEEHPIIRQLTGNEDMPVDFDSNTSIPIEQFDRTGSAEDSYHVLDADSSQWQTILDAKQGKSFIIQGPPGTGKSQTIANIIAELLAQNKSVLFMSEKMAALEVVKNRLARQGLDPFCLELHNNKINKKQVLEELRKTYFLEEKKHVPRFSIKAIDELKAKLYQYSDAIHKPVAPLNLTPYEAFGKLSSAQGTPSLFFSLNGIGGITPHQLKHMEQFAAQLDACKDILIRSETKSWVHTLVKRYTLDLEHQITQRFPSLAGRLETLHDLLKKLFSDIGISWPITAHGMDNARSLERHLQSSEIPFLQQWFRSHTSPSLQQSKTAYMQARNQYRSLHDRQQALLANFRLEMLNLPLQAMHNSLFASGAELVQASGMAREELIRFVWEHCDEVKSLVHELTALDKELDDTLRSISQSWSTVDFPYTLEGARRLVRILTLLELIAAPPVPGWFVPGGAVVDALTALRQTKQDIEFLAGMEQSVAETFYGSIWDIELQAMNERLRERYLPLFTSPDSLCAVWDKDSPHHGHIIGLEAKLTRLRNQVEEAVQLTGLQEISFTRQRATCLSEQLERIGAMEYAPTDMWFQQEKRELIRKQLTSMLMTSEQLQELAGPLEERYNSEVIELDAAESLTLLEQFDRWFDTTGKGTAFWKQRNELVAEMNKLNLALDELQVQHRYGCQWFNEAAFVPNQLRRLASWFEQLAALPLVPPTAWFQQANQQHLQELLNKAKLIHLEIAAVEGELFEKYDEGILTLPLEEIENRMVNEYATAIWRWLKPAFSKERAQMQYYLKRPNKLSYEEMKQDLKLALKARQVRHLLEADRIAFENSFGSYYQGDKTDWKKLKDYLGIIEALCGEIAFEGMSLSNFTQAFADTQAKGIPYSRIGVDFRQRAGIIRQELETWSGVVDKLAYWIDLGVIKYEEADILNMKGKTDEFGKLFQAIWQVYNRYCAFLKEDHESVNAAFQTWRNDLIAIRRVKELRKQITSMDQINTVIFGRAYRGLETDWKQLKSDMERTFSILDSLASSRISVKSFISLWTEWSSNETKWTAMRGQLGESGESLRRQIEELEEALSSIHDGVRSPNIKSEDTEAWRILLHWLGGYEAAAKQFQEDCKRISECMLHPTIFHPEILVEQLPKLCEVGEIRRKQEELEDRIKDRLGGEFDFERTDWTALEQTITAAKEFIDLWSSYGWGIVPEVLRHMSPSDKSDWTSQRTFIQKLLEKRSGLMNSHLQRLQPVMDESAPLASSSDWLQGFSQLAENWQGIKQELELFLIDSAPLTPEKASAGLQAGLAVLSSKMEIDRDHEHYENSLQHLYRSEETDWDDIAQSIEWSERLLELFKDQVPDKLLTWLADSDLHASMCSQLTEALTLWDQTEGDRAFLATVFSNHSRVYQGNGGEHAGLDAMATQLRQWTEHVRFLSDWLTKKQWREEAEQLGLSEFLAEIEAMTDAKEALEASSLRMFRHRFYTLWLVEAYDRLEEIAAFSVQKQEGKVEQFVEQDRRIGDINSLRLFNKLIDRKKAYLRSYDTHNERVFFENELRKLRSKVTIRDLYRNVPNLLLHIKPCVMMSPLTVSENIDPENVRFDVVIFDESSQIRSEEAIGAIVRGKQVIIAGDSKQMPPSSFFDSINGGIGDEDGEDEIYESILDECSAFLESRPLNWHYRSKHESLIAFSNKHIYDDGLHTFPSSSNKSNEGISFVHVADGVYDRGKSRKNVNEAAKVANLVIEQLQREPSRSLGVIAFSSAQEEAIADQLEKLRRQYPHLDSMFDEEAKEPFFIKNLENVQGDERDVIIFSVGYGKDKHGQISYNFGPLNRAGGERRLNVAVTRARYTIQVVSSLLDTDLEDSKLNKKGAQHLKKYIYFSRTKGGFTPSEGPSQVKVLEESTIEEDIYRTLQSKGYKVEFGVGASSIGVDLAVVDPSDENRYILGILLDGISYNSSRTARDRERLRSDVLKHLGWNIQRIWAQSWATNKAAESQKLEQIIRSSM